jgi:hypothetical protein
MVGADDKIVSPQTARETAAGYPAHLWELEGHGHMLVLEPGAEDIARRIATWIRARGVFGRSRSGRGSWTPFSISLKARSIGLKERR